MKGNNTSVKLPNYIIRKIDKYVNIEPKEWGSRPDFIKFLVNLYEYNLYNNGGKHSYQPIKDDVCEDTEGVYPGGEGSAPINKSILREDGKDEVKKLWVRI